MPSRFYSFSLSFAALLVLGSCTLQPLPPLVKVQVRLNGETRRDRLAGRGRSGPALDAMKCYGVIVNGATGAVRDSQVYNRSVSCLGLNGAFNGPYTYAQLQQGVALSLPAAQYTFSVVGFDGVANCGAGPSDLYNATAAAENYAVGSPVVANLASDSGVTIDARGYVPATATNRTPSCPVQSDSCDNADLCDTFTGADGTLLSNHLPDVGSAWTPAGVALANLANNAMSVTTTGASGEPAALFQLLGSQRAAIVVRGTFGESPSHMAFGAVLRYADINNYVVGEYFRTDGTSLCGIQIVEHVSGVASTLDAKYLNYPSECPWRETVTLSFSYDGVGYQLIKGSAISQAVPTNSLVGNYVGVAFTRYGMQLSGQSVDFFKLNVLPP